MTPKRIQRKRTKGWRMPEGAVYVGRPTKWGNPFSPKTHVCNYTDAFAFQFAVRHNCEMDGYPTLNDVVAELRGKDLCCWCPLDQPCHADVLLELANAGEGEQ